MIAVCNQRAVASRSARAASRSERAASRLAMSARISFSVEFTFARISFNVEWTFARITLPNFTKVATQFHAW